ncbi:MAG: efflux RND transporter permease subunit [Candidatus Latescibacterota bacterium]
MKAPVSWMAKNHVAANLFMGFIMLSGLFSMMQTKKETFPEMSLDQIQVQVPYRGAAPTEVEEAVCKRIEERVRGLEGVRRVRSTAAEGIGVVSVEMERGVDMTQMLDDIKNAVDRIDTFPTETEKPVIKELTRRSQVIDVVLYGAVGEKALKIAAERVRDDLRNSGVISQVELSGVRVDEISIEVSDQALRRYGLTFDQLTAAVRRTSLDLPAGSVESEDGEILLRTQGLMRSGREYEEVVVLTRPDGTTLTLGDIASVRDGFEDNDLVSRFNGQPAAVVQVYRTGDQSALDISAYVHEYVKEKQSLLPNGISIDYARDDARILRGRMDLLISNARLGLVLVFICLSFFLDLKLAFWVMMGIPISFLGAFLLMEPFDASINMLSLFAFIVALGIVVDDAIIVGENVYAHREKGKNFLRAAIDGAIEVGTPVVFSIMTSVAAFMPLFFIEGMMGKFMSVIPVIVIAVLLLSLIESLFILPAHLSSKGDGIVSRAFDRLFRQPLAFHSRIAQSFDRGLKHFIGSIYQPTLRLALANPLSTTALAYALMMFTVGLVAGGHVKFVFMPKIESDWLTVSVNMPQGTTVDQTTKIVELIEKKALQLRAEIDEESGGNDSIYRNVFTYIGDQPMGRRSSMTATGGASGRGHLGEVTIELKPAEERDLGSTEIEARLRQLVGEVPGPESVIFSSSLFSAGNAIEIELASDQFEQLPLAVERLKEQIAQYAGTGDIQDSFEEGKLEMKLQLKPQARTLGITLSDLARQVRQGFFGDQVLRFQRGSDDVRVMVRYPQSERRTMGDVRAMRVRTPTGAEIPFDEVASVEVGHGFSTIQRTDGQRVVTVSASVDEKAANADEINGDLAARFLPALANDYAGLRYSFGGEQRERSDSLESMFFNFTIALFAIYVLLAIPFKSYLQPFIVMSAIPFGIIGAVWGHLFMGIDLAMLSLFGIIALSGVVVNDSLVLLSFYNQLRKEGVDSETALIEAGSQRFRPILLTSLTTFFGLLPMIMEKSVQAQFLIPMAVSLAFGIIFATFIILIGVPVSAIILERAQAFASRLSERGTPSEFSAEAAG